MDGIKSIVRSAFHYQAETFPAAPDKEQYGRRKNNDKRYNISCQNILFLI